MKESLKKILLWSQKYTKTDMLYLTKGGAWLGIGHGIQVLSGFILAIAFANLLPKQAYGTYQFVMSAAAILSAFTLSGMNIAIKRASAQGVEGALRYGFHTQIKWSIGIMLGGGVLATYYFLNNNTTLALSFLIVGSCAPFIEGFSLYKSYLIGTRRFRESAFLGFWRRPLLITTILTTLFITDDPLTIVFVYFTTSAISAGLLYGVTVRKYKLPLIANLELKKYSKHLSIMGIISTISHNTDKILIFHFVGAEALAIYMLALLPTIHLLKMFSLLGGDLLFPKLAQQSFSVLRKSLPYKVFLFFIISCSIVGSYILVAPYIYGFIFPAYPEAAAISQIIVLALLAKPFMLYGQVFAAHGMKKDQHVITIATALFNILILFILIPSFEIYGAAWSFVLLHVFWGIMVLTLFRRKKTMGA
jgi:O-antigen/teichoic acid export membrane protein